MFANRDSWVWWGSDRRGMSGGFEAARGAGRPREKALRNNRAQPGQNRDALANI
jgi:hypothetical protein